MAGPSYTENAASEYLATAYEALSDAHDPIVVYKGLSEADDRPSPGFHSVIAGRQLVPLRVCIVFTAFACEAAANEFLAARLLPTSPVFKMLDRRDTIEKLHAGTEIVLGAPLFDPGREPLQSVRELFRVRNDLVHARPHNPENRGMYRASGALADLGPTRAGRFVVAAAQVMVDLGQHFSPSRYFYAETVARHGDYIRQIGTRALDRRSKRPMSVAELSQQEP